MFKKVFAIYDCKTEAFFEPFYSLTIGEAERALEAVVNRPDHTFNLHPSHFTLFEIGTFDTVTARFDTHPAAISLLNLQQLLRKPPVSQCSCVKA